MRALFIVNPTAGHGRGLARWNDVASALLSANPGSEQVSTTGRGDASALAQQGLRSGFEAIIAVGGDGTLCEVVHGFLSSPEGLRGGAVVGTWPAGSGCDVARQFKIGRNPGVLLEMLSSPRPRRVDAARASCGAGADRRMRYFFNVAGVGLPSEVTRRLESGKGKRWGGTLSYLLASIGAIASAKAREMRLVVDGVAQEPDRFHIIVLANGGIFGGGMRVAPGADREDGRLDLVTLGELSALGLLRHLPKVYSGAHMRLPQVRHRRVSRVEISLSDSARLPIDVDGELWGELPASFEVVPGAVPFLCP